MENNVRALQLINESDASIFLQHALRYYAREIISKDSNIPLVELLKVRFRVLAQSYLDWENQDLKREIEIIDSQDRVEFQALLSGKVSQLDDVDWPAIEEKAVSSFPQTG